MNGPGSLASGLFLAMAVSNASAMPLDNTAWDDAGALNAAKPAVEMLSVDQSSPAPTPGHPVMLPTRYFADHFIVEPVTTGRQTLSMYTDTGGGLFVYADAVERLHLNPIEETTPQGKHEWVTLPEFLSDHFIPPPIFENIGGRIEVWPLNEAERRGLGGTDGMLGTAWFGGRVWTFDYPKRALLWRAAADVPAHDPSHVVGLGLKQGEAFPRITVTIDGEPIDLLFDTGAGVTLTAKAVARIGDGLPADRATSFIDASVYARWVARHPDWRVIDHAEAWGGEHQSIIEVPQVMVAGYVVGPVWFTRRTDVDFQWMSSFMDRHIDGALGGNALRSFRITVDYPNQTAVFER